MDFGQPGFDTPKFSFSTNICSGDQNIFSGHKYFDRNRHGTHEHPFSARAAEGGRFRDGDGIYSMLLEQKYHDRLHREVSAVIARASIPRILGLFMEARKCNEAFSLGQ